ncbi:MAG: hypothetical protein ACTHM9_04840 [Gemmatimonadales bacterium]
MDVTPEGRYQHAVDRIHVEAQARQITSDEVIVRLVSLWAAAIGYASSSESCQDALRLCGLD